MNTGVSPWTDAAVDQLKLLVSEGLSASQIAAELNCGMTRNAIIGKIHRLGLSFSNKPRQPRQLRQPSSSVLFNRQNHRNIVNRAVQKKATMDIYVPPVEPPPPFACVELMDLDEHHCRWPIGDLGSIGFGFCGSPKIKLSSYCSHHRAVSIRR